jgi:hypothetical protein
LSPSPLPLAHSSFIVCDVIHAAFSPHLHISSTAAPSSMSAPAPPAQVGEWKVQVYLYDLSQGMARALSQQFLGKQIDGIWHTGVVVYGHEYFVSAPNSRARR